MQGAKIVLTKHETKQGKNNALLLKTQVSDSTSSSLASLLPNLAMNSVQQVSEGQEDI